MHSDLSGPFCESLGDEAVTDLHSYVAVCQVHEADARATALDAIKGSILRPEDIDGAEVGPTLLHYVPFWRVDVAVEGSHVRIAGHVRTGSLSLPIPLPSSSQRDTELLIVARRMFPFQPKLITTSKSRGTFGRHESTWGWRGIRVRLDELTPSGQAPALDGTVIEADVSRADAEVDAKRQAVSAAMPTNAFLSEYKPTVRSLALIQYPLYVTCYRYEGHAAAGPGQRYWVLVSGRNGKIVGSHHPSALRSVTRKLRSLISF